MSTEKQTNCDKKVNKDCHINCTLLLHVKLGYVLAKFYDRGNRGLGIWGL